MNITVLGLTNSDVNLKRMHQLYIVNYKPCISEIFISKYRPNGSGKGPDKQVFNVKL